MRQAIKRIGLVTGLLIFSLAMQAQAEALKPFILGNTPPGDLSAVTAAVETAVAEQGFTVVGSYSPFPNATVICASHPELSAAAAKAENGGFGAAQRIAVTEINGKIQVTYMNPAYLGTAYGLGKLPTISSKLQTALGSVQSFGANGVEESKLGPGKYHYKIMMPYFNDIDELNSYPDYQTGVATVEKNLAAGLGGTAKVYRIDLPGKEISVFGVAITLGDGPDSGAKDTDKEILDIVDFQDIRSTAYLPTNSWFRAIKPLPCGAATGSLSTFPIPAWRGHTGLPRS